jgi:hypothetical protein
MSKLIDARGAFVRATVSLAILYVMGIAVAYDARGQAVAQVSGTVTDQSGAVLPGVEITMTQTDTGVARSTISNETGFYGLPNLPIGPYRLEASLAGFRSFVQTGIVLQVGSAPSIPIILRVGQVSESVSVEANASQVETRAIGVGTVVESQRIVDLPLNGRQPTDLITLAGSAVQTGTSAAQTMRTGVVISVAGGLADGVQYNYDGAPHINTFDGSGMPLPFPDALQEFRVATSTQDASALGRTGGSVNAVTKSGTNAFHGDAFEFVRNYAVNARDFFSSAPNDGLKRNQFGGTFGGPIKKDKIFFFTGYQGSYIRQLVTKSPTNVPTQQMLQGDFTAYASAACQGTARTLRGPFVNNRINPSQLSPAAVKISSMLPAPLDACGLVQWSQPANEDDHQVPVRVDYQVNDKQALFARYLFTKQFLPVPYSVNNNLLTTGTPGHDDRAQNITLGHTFLLSSNTVNSARLFANRVAALLPGANFFGTKTVGINSYTYTPNYVNISVTGGFSVGGTTKNAFSYITDFGASDDYSIVHGSHLFGFGGYYMRSINNLGANGFSDGQFMLTGSFTGLGLADFLTGQVANLRQQTPNPLNVRQNFFSIYAKDTWKLNSHLTLNYGLTWTPYFAASFPQGDIYNFSLPNFYEHIHSSVFPTAPAGFLYPGDKGFNGNSGIQNQWGHFDPRVGIAWDPKGDGQMVVRVGGGNAHGFAGQVLLLNEETATPFHFQTSLVGPVSLDNPWANYPGGDPFPFLFNKEKPLFPAYSVFAPVPPKLKDANQYSWNLGIQRQLTRNWFASATYLGTHIVHVPTSVELNPGIYVPGNCAAGQYGLTAPGPCTSSANLNQRRALNLYDPSAQLGYLTQYDDGNTQSYNALQLATNWRMQNNISLNANYTWSKCRVADAGKVTAVLAVGANYLHSGFGNNLPGANNRKADIGYCVSDRRQVANVTMVVQTPPFSNNLARKVGTGWMLSTLVTATSGAPFSVVTGAFPEPATGFGGTASNWRPNQILPDPYSTAKGTAGPAAAGRFSLQWLNPAAFAAPALGTFGNLGAYSLFGPAYWEWDAALARQFTFRERQKVEIRFEAFNVTNSVRPGFLNTASTNPNLTLSAASQFGTITTDATPPSANTAPARVLQFALKYSF